MIEQARFTPHSTQDQRPYDILAQPLEISTPPESIEFLPNPSYNAYLLLHKVLVGTQSGRLLEGIYNNLRDESMPRYLSAAGWAATESAMVRPQLPTQDRIALLDAAQDCWERALLKQRELNTSQADCVVEDAYPHRIALDMAILPLLKGVFEGQVTRDLRRKVNLDCINIAEANAVQIDLANKDGNIEGLGGHLGFGYECNALLAFNLRFLRGWFIIPSLARSDTGYHYPHQTHDLMIIHHRDGRIINATPIEVKSAAQARDRQRFKALLVRGKMHLSEPGKYTPTETLNAISAVYEGRADKKQQAVFDMVSERLVTMVRDYNAGEFLGYLASERSVTRFRDNRRVVQNHPGLAVAGS